MKRRRSKKTDPDLVSAQEAQRLLGCGHSTFERLVASGRLQPAGVAPGKGQARLYRRVDVEALAADLRRPAPGAASIDVVVADYASQAVDFRSRRGRLEAAYADPTWRQAWAEFVRWVASVTATWPAAIAAAAAKVPAAEAIWIDHVAPDPRERLVVRPLLEALAAHPELGQALRPTLVHVAEPAPLPALENPTILDQARHQAREERTLLRAANTLARGGQRRDKVQQQINAALANWNAHWTAFSRHQLFAQVEAGATQQVVRALAEAERKRRLRALENFLEN